MMHFPSAGANISEILTLLEAHLESLRTRRSFTTDPAFGELDIILSASTSAWSITPFTIQHFCSRLWQLADRVNAACNRGHAKAPRIASNQSVAKSC